MKGLHFNLHRRARFAMNLKASIRKFGIRYPNSVSTGYQHFTAKKYLSANCNYTEENDGTFDLYILNGLRCKNLNHILIGHLNIKSLRDKLEILVSLIVINLDILMISETKLDMSFPISQYLIPDFKNPILLARSSSGVGIILYIRERIPFKLLKSNCLLTNTEAFLVDFKINKNEWLICCSYSPQKALIQNQMNELGKALDIYLQKYDYFLLIGDFNSEISEKSMHDFYNVYNLVYNVYVYSVSDTSTSFKNPENPSCIDLLLTNSKNNFDETCIL